MTTYKLHCHNPLHCILPPYVLSEIAAQGSDQQKKKALINLRKSGGFRGERQDFADITPRRRGATSGKDKTRLVYDTRNQEQLPGTIVRNEGSAASGDPAVDEAYDGAGDTFDLYCDVYDRNSIDGRGLDIISTVHYGVGFDNAFWNGDQMAYGDGDEDLPVDQRMFNRFTISLDIIGHELAHGVTQHEANLVYRDQSGALNESMSDVFGSLVKQYKLRQTADQADWLIGAGLFTENVNAQAIRSMKAPGTAYDDPNLGRDPQPAHLRDIYTGINDNGGVHINSGIPNHAFYNTAIELGGFAWEKAGHIWYIALRDRFGSSTNFQEAARTLFQVAGELYGNGSSEQDAVVKGWDAVGIDVQGINRPDPSSPQRNPMPPSGCMVAPLTFLGAYLTSRGGDI